MKSKLLLSKSSKKIKYNTNRCVDKNAFQIEFLWYFEKEYWFPRIVSFWIRSLITSRNLTRQNPYYVLKQKVKIFYILLLNSFENNSVGCSQKNLSFPIILLIKIHALDFLRIIFKTIVMKLDAYVELWGFHSSSILAKVK